IHHLFSAGLNEEGLDAMIAQHASYGREFDHRQVLALNVSKIQWCGSLALETAARLGRSRRQIADLRRWMMAGTITLEYGRFDPSAQLWLEQLVHDSGLDLYRADQANGDAGARLMQALQAAQARYLATPEHDRVYAVDEAIRLLAEFVVYALALGARTHDSGLLRQLP